MPKRKFSEHESASEDGGCNPASEDEEILEPTSDMYVQENEDGGEQSEDYEEEYSEHSGLEDMLGQDGTTSGNHVSPMGEGRGQEYDAEDILRAEAVSKEFFDKDFFRVRVIARFADFFSSFGDRKYVRRIRTMCAENLESIDISYLDIERYSDELLRLLNLHPERTIELMDAALNDVVKMYFSNYHLIRPQVHARIVDLPVLDNIRFLRNRHLGKLVRVCGVVTRRSGVFPLYSIVKFTCLKCKAIFGPFIASSFRPSQCFECQSKGPFMINTSETVYKDFQKLTIQEVPGTVPPGSLPRAKEVLLFYDLIDCAKPGEEVEVTGVYKNNFSVSLNIKNGFPVFFTVIEAASVTKRVGRAELTEDDIKDIQKMARHPEIKSIIYNSIAPSIYGHRDVKRALALAMFGGVSKDSSSHRIRGDINVLLLGDPGMAKSQFLRYVANTSHRAVLATGQGASGVGLTASVRKDPVLKEWTLEGGALVLADRGVCLIDEFDKMDEHDRTSIHEAMEQQSISISKAGIVATLHARCSVIAAANPIRGRYNSSLTFGQNVNLSDPIISRFDILCVVRDVIDAAEDERMANFVIGAHSTKEEEVVGFDQHRMMMGQDLLKKYVMYARHNVAPIFSEVDFEKVSHLYSDLRKESMASGFPITVRHIESIVRMSEALAKMRLRNSVSGSDIDEAIDVALDSFMGAQKYSVTKSLRKKFIKYFNKSTGDVLVFLLREMFNEKLRAFHAHSVPADEFERRAGAFGFSVPSTFYSSEPFRDGGFLYSRESRKIVRSSD
jgi:DNA replication licensing factor MCM2